jgi:type I restriction enzyme S subunit
MTESDWSEYRIDDIGRLVGGATPSTGRPEYWNGGIHWTTTKRLGPSYFLDSGEKFISEAGLANSSTTLIPKGNLLIGTRVGVGKISVNTVDVAISQDLTGILVDTTRFDPVFLAFCLSQPDIRGVMLRQARGVTIKGLPREDLRAISFRAPPKPKQQQIATVLVTAQRAIEIEDKLIATARGLKQAAMRQLFSRGVFGEEQKHSEIGLTPASWNVLPLGKVAILLSGGTPPKNDPMNWIGPIPWASPKDIKRPRLADTKDHISERALAASSTLAPEGSLFVVIRGMILAKDIPIALAEAPMAFNQDIKAIVPGNALSSSYLLYAVQAFKGLLFLRVGRSAHGTGTLLSNAIEDFLIPVPSKDEQEDIASTLGTLDRTIALHEQRRIRLMELFSVLLPRLMNGDVLVQPLVHNATIHAD